MRTRLKADITEKQKPFSPFKPFKTETVLLNMSRFWTSTQGHLKQCDKWGKCAPPWGSKCHSLQWGQSEAMGRPDGMLIKPNRLLCQWKTFKGPLKKITLTTLWKQCFKIYFPKQLLPNKMASCSDGHVCVLIWKTNSKKRSDSDCSSWKLYKSVCLWRKIGHPQFCKWSMPKNSKLKSGQLSSGLLLNCSLDGGDIIFFSIGVSHQVPKQSDQLYSKCVLIHLGPSRLWPPS